MNPRERFLNVMRGKAVDRVPIFLHGIGPCTTDSGVCEIYERVSDRMVYGVNAPSHVNRYLLTPSHLIKIVKEEKQSDGSIVTCREISTPKGKLTAITGRNPISRTVWTIKYPCENLEDIDRIRSIAWELPEDFETPVFDDLPEDFPERGYTGTNISSPFVCVAGMMSYEYYLELCISEFNLVRELTCICFERIMSLLDALLINRNIEYVWMGGCEWLTPPMGSPRLYEELVQKFEEPVIKRIHGGGAVSHVHCHGNIRSTLEMIIARGADFTEPVEPPPDGDITFAEAKSLAAGRIALGGNIEARILEHEDKSAVEQAAMAAFEGGKQRMVFQTSAGPICKMTPGMTANYHKLIDVWEENSQIQ